MSQVPWRALSLTSAAVALAAGAPAWAAKSAAPSPAATAKQFLERFNKGDVAGAEATHVAAPTIVDEVAPHHWQGDGAFKAWAGDLQKDAEKNGLTDEKVLVTGTDRADVDGDDAYVVLRTVFVYKQHKKAMEEPAHMAFSLHKDGEAWKITGWAWAGGKPHPAMPKATPAAAPGTPAAPAKP